MGTRLRSCIVVLAALAVTILLFPALVWQLGMELPQRLIDSGVEDFEGMDKEMAKASLDKVHLTYREQATLMVDERVMRVEQCPGTPSEDEFERKYVSMLVGFSAEIRPYTLFGIPMGTIVLPCNRSMRWGSF